MSRFFFFIFWISINFIKKKKKTEPYSEALKYLSQTITFMQQTNPKIYYHVFLHKIDADNLALEEKKNGFFFFFF